MYVTKCAKLDWLDSFCIFKTVKCQFNEHQCDVFIFSSHSLYNSRYRMVKVVTVMYGNIMLHSFTQVIFSYHL